MSNEIETWQSELQDFRNDWILGDLEDDGDGTIGLNLPLLAPIRKQTKKLTKWTLKLKNLSSLSEQALRWVKTAGSGLHDTEDRVNSRQGRRRTPVKMKEGALKFSKVGWFLKTTEGGAIEPRSS